MNIEIVRHKARAEYFAQCAEVEIEKALVDGDLSHMKAAVVFYEKVRTEEEALEALGVLFERQTSEPREVDDVLADIYAEMQVVEHPMMQRPAFIDVIFPDLYVCALDVTDDGVVFDEETGEVLGQVL